MNRDVVDWFQDYADLCFREFGDVVKLWITINEPRVTSLSGYGEGSFAPGVEGIGTNSYISAHHQILAHAAAYRLYYSQYAASQAGKVGIRKGFNKSLKIPNLNFKNFFALEKFLIRFFETFPQSEHSLG